MNYNDTQILWENTRTNMLKAGRLYPIKVYNGLVVNGNEVVAQFSDQRAALDAIIGAGWVRDNRNADTLDLVNFTAKAIA